MLGRFAGSLAVSSMAWTESGIAKTDSQSVVQSTTRLIEEIDLLFMVSFLNLQVVFRPGKLNDKLAHNQNSQLNAFLGSPFNFRNRLANFCERQSRSQPALATGLLTLPATSALPLTF